MLFLGRERERKMREGGIESEGMGGEWSLLLLLSSFLFISK
jgi:hypothetical protein